MQFSIDVAQSTRFHHASDATVLRVHCPFCGAQLDFNDGDAGRLGACTNCGGQMQLPSPQPPRSLVVTEPPRQTMLIIDAPSPHQLIRSGRRKKKMSSSTIAALAVASSLSGIAVIGTLAAMILVSPSPKRTAPGQASGRRQAEPVSLESPVPEEKKFDNEKFLREMKRAMDVAFVNADSLADEFSINALSASSKYDGRMLRIEGQVITATTNREGLPLVMLRTDSVWLVRVFIADSTVDAASEFRPGQRVRLLAAFAGVQGSLIELTGGVIADESMDDWLKGSKR